MGYTLLQMCKSMEHSFHLYNPIFTCIINMLLIGGDASSFIADLYLFTMVWLLSYDCISKNWLEFGLKFGL